MAIRSGLAVVAGNCRCDKYSGRLQGEETTARFMPTIPEILEEVRGFVASERKRLETFSRSNQGRVSVLRSQIEKYVQENSEKSISSDLDVWLKEHPGRINSQSLQKYLNDEIDWSISFLAAKRRDYGRVGHLERSCAHNFRSGCYEVLEYLGLERVRTVY